MVGYRLLGEPVSGSTNLDYRGTYRWQPPYIDELPMEAPVNQLWMQETELMIGDYFTSLDQAERVQEIYAQAGFYYDLVIVGDKSWYPPTDTDSLQFMGCDLSHVSDYSLLSWDLTFDKPAPNFFHQRENPIYQPLLLLIQNYFRPLLNSYRLLPTVEDADFFLNVTSAMTEGFGAVWENVEYGAFAVTKMYMVRSREDMQKLYKQTAAVVAATDEPSAT